MGPTLREKQKPAIPAPAANGTAAINLTEPKAIGTNLSV
jgi:hypothetical protein